MSKNAVMVYAYGEDYYLSPQYREIVGVATTHKQLMSLLKQEKDIVKAQYDEIKAAQYSLFADNAQEIQLTFDPKENKCAYRIIPFKLDTYYGNL
ncbi:MAG: hypothetical protein K5854_01645 [Prevotella sp.]|nr:hypothetical protein [Prevotella sp.]